MISITLIKDQIERVLRHSQPGLDKAPLDLESLVQRWYAAKQIFLDAWGDAIYEFPEPVVFELSEEDKKTRLSSFTSYIIDTYDNETLADFIDEHPDSFFDNHLKNDVAWPGIAPIAKGTKFIKAFKYFESDQRILDDLQTQASMIIQENKVKGKLCFSVHPLDFLSSSENLHKWRSCHALDGDYRAGNLAYMLDNSTVICYLKTDDKLVQLPQFPNGLTWNNKKWRMLLYFSSDFQVMFAGRQYPFSSCSALNTIQRVILPSLNKEPTHWTKWYNDSFKEMPTRADPDRYRSDAALYDTYVAIDHYLYGLQSIIDDVDCLHYNDLLHSSCYKPYYCWSKYRHTEKAPHFTIGADVPCPCCGDTLNLSSSMLCVACEEKYGTEINDTFCYCDCCGRRTYRENMYWNESCEGLICSDCYETETRDCERCGENYYTCDVVYNHFTNQYLCPRCNEYAMRQQIVLKGLDY